MWLIFSVCFNEFSNCFNVDRKHSLARMQNFEQINSRQVYIQVQAVVVAAVVGVVVGIVVGTVGTQANVAARTANRTGRKMSNSIASQRPFLG